MTLTSKLTSRVAIMLMIAGSVAAAGCDTTTPVATTASNRSVGELGMNLTLPDGSSLNTVTYSITGNGITPLTGSIDVTQAGSTISAAVSGVPVGNNFTVTLTGTTTNGKSTCLGTASFNILAAQPTMVSVSMQCRAGATTNQVVINGHVNQCPTVTAFSVAPLSQTIPGSITVSAAAADPEMHAIAFTWADSASGGTFAAPHSASTTFACNLSGPTTITVSADDGAGCTDSASILVTCTSAAVCGDNTVGPGEQCDDGNTVNTDACVGTTCRNAVCGDGFVHGGVEACDDGNKVAGDGCENDCTVTPPPPGCGNGVVDNGEECDTGAGVHMSTAICAYPSCKSIICGNNRIDGSEVCDGTVGPTGPLGLGQVCNNCTSLVDNCRTCENANCTNYYNSNLVAGCYSNVAGATFVQQCVDVMNCARTNKCAYGSRGVELCYCGTAAAADCQKGTGVNGACKAQYEIAAGSTDPGVVTTRFGDQAYPVGVADNLLGCDLDKCGPAGGTKCVP